MTRPQFAAVVTILTAAVAVELLRTRRQLREAQAQLRALPPRDAAVPARDAAVPAGMFHGGGDISSEWEQAVAPSDS